MNEHVSKSVSFWLVQRVGGSWDGYWLTTSLHPDQEAFSGGIAY